MKTYTALGRSHTSPRHIEIGTASYRGEAGSLAQNLHHCIVIPTSLSVNTINTSKV